MPLIPEDAKEGTIRKKYGLSIDKNSVHGSDSEENAKKEIDFFQKLDNILIIDFGYNLYSSFKTLFFKLFISSFLNIFFLSVK